MDFDFNIILVPVTLFFGLIWLIDKLFLKQHQPKKRKLKKKIVDPTKKQSIDKPIKKNQGNYAKEVDAAKIALDNSRVAFYEVLKNHTDTANLEHLNINTDEDLDLDNIENLIKKLEVDTQIAEVKQAQRDYRDAKRQFNIVIQQQNVKPSNEHFLVRWAYDYFPVLAVVLIVRSFIIEPFNIPSPSMVPTLYTGDFVVVNKFAYGLRFPLFYKEIMDLGDPEHGDVAVFRYPENPKIYYIKRVIGLPGDTVSFDKGQLYLNDKKIATKSVDFTVDEVLTEHLYNPKNNSNVKNGSATNLTVQQAAIDKAHREENGASYYQEVLGDHTYLRRYLAYDEPKARYSRFLSSNITKQEGKWSVIVPEDQYFVMGDNSDRSGDSRFWGFVPDDNLAGKATYVWMHKKPGLSNLPTFAYNRSID